MGKRSLAILFICLFFTKALFASDPTGFWQTLDKKTKRPSSVIAVYPYQGKYYGRIIATYEDDGTLKDTIDSPKSRAPGIIGNPFYCGLDIVWGAKPGQDSDKFRGHVFDPRKGRIYNAVIWRSGENLILRGEVLVFGKNMTWPPFPESGFNATFKKPDISTFVPHLPQVNR